MDLLQAMRIYTRVVETGSFSRAAAELGVTQPTATKAVAECEQRLGARLLHRSTRGVSPTDVGSLYLERCRQVLRDVEEADGVASLARGELAGTLRIATSVGFGRRVMGPLVIQYMRAHPRLQLDLSFDDRYVNLVEQGIDVAVRMGRLADSSLGASYLGLNPWVIVAAPDYIAARGAPAQPADLAAHDCLVYSSVQGVDRWQLVGGAEAQPQAVPVRGPLRSNNLSSILAAAESGLGLAALPRYVAHEALAAGTVVEAMPAYAPPAQEVHAVYPSPRLVPRKVMNFIGWLREHMAGDWWAR